MDATEPQRGVLRQLAGQRGLACRNERVLNGVSPVNVSHLDRQMECETIEVRDYDRGVLRNVFAFCEVWTLCEEDRRAGNGQTCQGLRAVQERLVSRQETSSEFSCSVTNAPLSLGTRQRARWKSDRHFVERTIQDAKMEVGWDDLSSPKYRAYMHTLVIDALTICFVTRTKLKMRNPHPP